MPEPIVSARDVTKLFGAKAALDGLSAEVFPGDIVGVLGAGKTSCSQFGLLARLWPALPDVVIVTAIELVAAVALRGLAIARWRRIDWLQLRPLPPSNMLGNT
jgi:ABC-type phosphonate transport system ATPase subunit